MLAAYYISGFPMDCVHAAATFVFLWFGGEPLLEKLERVKPILERIGLPEEALYKYPHEFSGGQRQRLSIARAVARHPEIYIFDDSFSALDYKTDANLRLALSTALPESTVITVAQRVSSVKNCDLILVIEDGEIIGCGTHDELMATSEAYRDIYASQMRAGGADNE